jgi:hypothetical protein
MALFSSLCPAHAHRGSSSYCIGPKTLMGRMECDGFQIVYLQAGLGENSTEPKVGMAPGSFQ